MKTVFSLIVILILSLGSCSRNVQTSGTEKYQQTATDKFGDGQFDCSENQDMTFALCKHQLNTPGSTIQSWEYFVFDKKNEKVTVSETIDKGSVKWVSNSEIQVSKIPGTMTVDQTMDDYTWIVNVVTGERTKKSEYKKQQQN